MRLFSRKSHLQKLLDTVNDSLDVPSALQSAPATKALKAGLIAAGGLAGLTAGSAGVSSLRRRHAGTSDDS